jgi:CBS domain-containing protein
MNTNVQIISPEATVQAAAGDARRKDRLPTGGKPRKLVGIITEYDLLKIVEELEN